jgi:hypothetical protein
MNGKELVMVELNPTLQQALDAQQGEPLRIVDPRTQETYVLLPLDVYQRLQPARPLELAVEIAPGIERSREAFLRDLPLLLADPKKRGLWTVYHGSERLGISRDSRTLLRLIQRKGIAGDQFYLGVIRPHEPEPEEIEPIHPQHLQDLPAQP